MNIFTIGFAQKSAEDFFKLLIVNKIECLVDIRLNNSSQLAGFTKHKDLQYFLKTIVKIDYIHDIKYAPTKDILDAYKSGKISWEDYKIKYDNLISTRKVEDLFKNTVHGKYSNICLLCSEAQATNCHRRLLAEYLKSKFNDVKIVHL
ncbi:MAG: DUF488 domain-containing protein [Candidatus Gastranaerophilales bacterium]|nr:DUF488 domain-containing protein [Candidatus Gastranaerophilales bacterium]